jgi:hypothetical protein
VLSITIVNMMPKFGSYLTIVIYDRKTFIVQATVINILGRVVNYKGKKLYIIGPRIEKIAFNCISDENGLSTNAVEMAP